MTFCVVYTETCVSLQLVTTKSVWKYRTEWNFEKRISDSGPSKHAWILVYSSRIKFYSHPQNPGNVPCKLHEKPCKVHGFRCSLHTSRTCTYWLRAWWGRSHIKWKITLKKKTFQKNIIFSVYTCHDLRDRGVENITIYELIYWKNQKNIWVDWGKAAGLFIRVGLFAGGFFGSRLFCLRLFCLRLFCLRLFSWQAFL